MQLRKEKPLAHINIQGICTENLLKYIFHPLELETTQLKKKNKSPVPPNSTCSAKHAKFPAPCNPTHSKQMKIEGTQHHRLPICSIRVHSFTFHTYVYIYIYLYLRNVYLRDKLRNTVSLFRRKKRANNPRGYVAECSKDN